MPTWAFRGLPKQLKCLPATPSTRTHSHTGSAWRPKLAPPLLAGSPPGYTPKATVAKHFQMIKHAHMAPSSGCLSAQMCECGLVYAYVCVCVYVCVQVEVNFYFETCKREMKSSKLLFLIGLMRQLAHVVCPLVCILVCVCEGVCESMPRVCLTALTITTINLNKPKRQFASDIAHKS